MVQKLPGEVASGHSGNAQKFKVALNTYTFKTALGVGVQEEFKLENAYGYWELTNVFEFRLNCVHKTLLLAFPVSIPSCGRWDYNFSK